MIRTKHPFAIREVLLVQVYCVVDPSGHPEGTGDAITGGEVRGWFLGRVQDNPGIYGWEA